MPIFPSNKSGINVLYRGDDLSVATTLTLQNGVNCVFSDAYTHYQLVIERMKATTATGPLYIQWLNNGAAKTSSNLWGVILRGSTAIADYESSSANGLYPLSSEASAQLDTATASNCNLIMDIFRPKNGEGQFMDAQWQANLQTISSPFYYCGRGRDGGTPSTNYDGLAINLGGSSGNWSAKAVTLRGYKGRS